MSLTQYRSSDPLYIVIVHGSNAEHLLKQWAARAQVSVSVDRNRMKIFDAQTYYLFQINWPHNAQQVIIWDCWNRRHIYLA